MRPPFLILLPTLLEQTRGHLVQRRILTKTINAYLKHRILLPKDMKPFVKRGVVKEVMATRRIRKGDLR